MKVFIDRSNLRQQIHGKKLLHKNHDKQIMVESSWQKNCGCRIEVVEAQ